MLMESVGVEDRRRERSVLHVVSVFMYAGRGEDTRGAHFPSRVTDLPHVQGKLIYPKYF